MLVLAVRSNSRNTNGYDVSLRVLVFCMADCLHTGDILAVLRDFNRIDGLGVGGSFTRALRRAFFRGSEGLYPWAYQLRWLDVMGLKGHRWVGSSPVGLWGLLSSTC